MTNKGREAAWKLERLKISNISSGARMLAEEIREAVKAGATSWEKLKTTSEELDQFVLDAQGREKK